MVIGILIALSINNWNESRKIEIKEIKIEQNYNISQLKEYVGKIQKRFNSAEIIQKKYFIKNQLMIHYYIILQMQ